MAPSARPMDHSLIYREFKLRNLPHWLRLRGVLRVLKRVGIDSRSWADVGCSNGYIVGRVLEETSPSEVFGFDHLESHLEVARERVPAAQFLTIDLNRVDEPARRFDVVSCFETLEHVGHLRNAITSLAAMVEPGGRLIITVPIEIGFGGTLKYVIKRRIYRYSLSELPEGDGCSARYEKALFAGSRMSSFRSPERDGWGTHFGFDWRDVDDILRDMAIQYTARNDLFTRYYEIAAPTEASHSTAP